MSAERLAVFSSCRTWRYTLERRWGPEPSVLFVALNPSTADEREDDQTVRKCVGFARRWGYGGLLVGNLFAYRATDPRAMARAEDPVGPDNDYWLRFLAERAAYVVASWGASALARGRAADVLPRLGQPVYALRLTKDGAPWHPLYVPGDARPVRYDPETTRPRRAA